MIDGILRHVTNQLYIYIFLGKGTTTPVCLSDCSDNEILKHTEKDDKHLETTALQEQRVLNL